MNPTNSCTFRMNIYRFDSNTDYKVDSFDCGDSDLND